jgi:hypothetical protein
MYFSDQGREEGYRKAEGNNGSAFRMCPMPKLSRRRRHPQRRGPPGIG